MELASISTGLDVQPLPMIHELVDRDLSPSAYVDALQQYARTSRAARHPLLSQIASASFRDPRATLRRFFAEYFHYSRRFTRFLASVVASLEEAEHRTALVPSCSAEAGYIDRHHRNELLRAGLDPNDVAGAHSALYRRFLLAIRVPPGDLDGAAPHVATT